MEPAAFSLKCDCIFVCGGFMRRLEVDRFGGRTRLLQWHQELQGAHCRSLRALRQFWCRHRACSVLFRIASSSVLHSKRVRRSLSVVFFFFRRAEAQVRTTVAHLTSVGIVTTYKKKAMIETWSEPSPLQKQMWTSLKRMVRSRGGDSQIQQRRELQDAKPKR